MSSDYKCNTAHTLLHILKQYCMFKTTENEFIGPKEAENIILHYDG